MIFKFNLNGLPLTPRSHGHSLLDIGRDELVDEVMREVRRRDDASEGWPQVA